MAIPEKPLKFGLIGSNGAGKSTICQLLKDRHHFWVISLSDFVREEVGRRGLPKDRDHLTATANELKQTHGANFLAHQALKSAADHPSPRVVFDSVRHPDEMEILKKEGVVFIGVDAAVETRYARIRERAGDTDAVDFETFKRQDNRERTGESSGQSINSCLVKCQIILHNEGSFEQIQDEIETLIQAVSL